MLSFLKGLLHYMAMFPKFAHSLQIVCFGNCRVWKGKGKSQGTGKEEKRKERENWGGGG